MEKIKASKVLEKQETIDFKNAGIADVQFSSGMVKMAGFYRIHLTWQKCLVAVCLGLLFSLATVFFIQNTGLYSGGSTAVCQGIARLVHTAMDISVKPESMSEETWKFLILLVYNLLFWCLYLLFNLGLLLFYIKTMNREFIYLSAIYICVSQLTGICMGLIPGVADIQIFGNTSTVNEVLRAAKVECIVFYPNIFPEYVNETGNMVFDWTRQLTTCTNDLIKSAVTNENLTKAFSLVIYALLYSFIYAFCNAGIYILGGSSMGTESIAIYISEKRNKEVGTTLKFIQTCCLITGIILGSYTTGIIAGGAKTPGEDGSAAIGSYASWQYIFNANLVASLLYVFVNGALINSLFPTRKLGCVEVFTQKAKGILDNLRTHKYPHPTTVVHSFGGYSGVSNNVITTVLPIMALTNYIRSIREVDKTCLVAVTTLDDCVGRMGLEKHMNLKIAYDREKADKIARNNTYMQLDNEFHISELFFEQQLKEAHAKKKPAKKRKT